jgi:regulator of sirC expression with transglutaminase-like and TPR domain
MAVKATNKELEALVRMMDEPDGAIFGQIRNKILSYGTAAVPYLEQAWENDLNQLVQVRLEDLIHEIQFTSISQDLGNWCDIGTRNLMLGYMLVTKYQYPDLDEEQLKAQIERIKQDVWLELNDNLTGMEKIKVLNHFLFDIHKFDGSRTNFYSPQNYYINTVMESHKGSPLALSMIYLIIAQALAIPVFGVNLPEHFILAYADITNDDNSFMHDENKILFYINPFTKGTVFTRREIDLFLDQLKVEMKKEYYLPCTNTEIIRRLLRNLMQSYEKLGQKDKSLELEQLIEVLSKCR